MSLPFDATTMPNSASILHESNLARLSPKPRCTMLPILSDIDVKYATQLHD
jgi:hypothetical protein